MKSRDWAAIFIVSLAASAIILGLLSFAASSGRADPKPEPPPKERLNHYAEVLEVRGCEFFIFQSRFKSQFEVYHSPTCKNHDQ